MDHAKIRLSKQETELVNNKDWLLTKQIIIQKIIDLLGQLHQRYKLIMEKELSLPDGFQKPGGKISRGENYKGLPYLILDYPAVFNKENIFAVRTMFWWGNYFSISLHLSGKYVEDKSKMMEDILLLKAHNFYICINESQWEHSIDDSNFVKADILSDNQWQQIMQKGFFKVSKTHSPKPLGRNTRIFRRFI